MTYRYDSNGRLRIVGKLVGRDALVTTVFQRVNELSSDDFAYWIECLAERTNRPKGEADPPQAARRP